MSSDRTEGYRIAHDSLSDLIRFSHDAAIALEGVGSRILRREIGIEAVEILDRHALGCPIVADVSSFKGDSSTAFDLARGRASQSVIRNCDSGHSLGKRNCDTQNVRNCAHRWNLEAEWTFFPAESGALVKFKCAQPEFRDRWQDLPGVAPFPFHEAANAAQWGKAVSCRSVSPTGLTFRVAVSRLMAGAPSSPTEIVAPDFRFRIARLLHEVARNAWIHDRVGDDAQPHMVTYLRTKFETWKDTPEGMTYLSGVKRMMSAILPLDWSAGDFCIDLPVVQGASRDVWSLTQPQVAAIAC